MGQDKLKQAQRGTRQAHQPTAEEQVKAAEPAPTDERAAEALRADPTLTARMGPEQRARAVKGLQKTHGNAAAQRMLQRQVEPEEEEEEAEEEAVQQISRGKGEKGPKGATAGQPYAVASKPREAIPEELPLLKFPSWLGMPGIKDILQKKPAEEVSGPGPLHADLTRAIDVERGQGQALDEATRAEMETALGADFGAVRVHTGAEADALSRALGAAAFTTGADVFFREGEYQAESEAGRELLAHELTHVAQQGGEASGPLTLGPVDDAFEREADRAAEEAASGKGSESAADTATQPGAVQRGLFDDLLGTARGLVGGGAGAAREAIGAGAGAASSAVGQVGGMASGLLGNLTGMGGGLVSQGAGALGGLLGNLGGRATGAIGNLAGRATEAVSGLPGGGMLGGLIGNLAGMGTSAVERGVGAAGGLVGRGAGMAQNLITGLGGMGERAIGGGTSIAENLIGTGSQAAEGVVGMAERGAGGGLDVVEGIANAAENMPEMPFGPMMPQIPETPGAGGIGGMFSELLGRFF